VRFASFEADALLGRGVEDVHLFELDPEIDALLRAGSFVRHDLRDGVDVSHPAVDEDCVAERLDDLDGKRDR
jgi:hypothetical protein